MAKVTDLPSSLYREATHFPLVEGPLCRRPAGNRSPIPVGGLVPSLPAAGCGAPVFLTPGAPLCPYRFGASPRRLASAPLEPAIAARSPLKRSQFAQAAFDVFALLFIGGFLLLLFASIAIAPMILFFGRLN